MSIQTYLNQTEKRYRMRLKTVRVLDDAAMDAIEFAAAPYLPLELSRPKRSILQSRPADFPRIAAAEVSIVDMTFGLPVTPEVLRDLLWRALGATEAEVVVRNVNDPMEIEGERQAAMDALDAEASKKGWTSAALLDDREGVMARSDVAVEDPDAYFGDRYNGALVAYLSSVSREREDRTVRAANAPFTWLDLPDQAKSRSDLRGTSQEPVQDANAFNSGIGGLPKVAANSTVARRVASRALDNNVVDDRLPVTRLYKDAKGNRIAVRQAAGSAG